MQKKYTHRSRLRGEGFKPPQAAVVKHHGGERLEIVAAIDCGR